MQEGVRVMSWEHNGQQQQWQLELCSSVGRRLISHGGEDCLCQAPQKSQRCSYPKSEMMWRNGFWHQRRNNSYNQRLIMNKTSPLPFPCCKGGDNCCQCFGGGGRDRQDRRWKMLPLWPRKAHERDAHDRSWINILLLFCLLPALSFPWMPGLASLAVPMALVLEGHALLSDEEVAAMLLCSHLDKD